jgi:glucose/arabinose dehydrogenase
MFEAMRPNALRAAAAVGFAGIALVIGAGTAHAATLPTGFEERTILSGLSLPTAITWAPDGRMFVAEKKGVVRVVNTNGTTAQLLDISSHVYGIADRGLLGIATDSDFANNHWLYLLYVYNPTPQPSGLARTSRLTRVTVSDTNTASAETVILGSVSTPPCPAPSNSVDCIPSDMDSHAIGTVRSAPDGTLWVGNGDGSDWSKVDPMALRTYNEQSLSGKIIHVDRNGMGLPGHAFCPTDNDLTHVCTKLYAKGMRNPFRFTLRQGTGPVVGDVGWEEHEEIDLMTAPGRNYGWPCYEATVHTSGYRDLAGCPPEYAKEGTPQADTLSDYDYPHDASNGYQAAVVAGPEYLSGSYPSDYVGDIFFADYVSAFIKRLKVDAQGHVTGTVPFATGSPAVDLELGPGNELYYADFGDGNPGTGSVKRVVYTPSNRTPIPQASASPTFGSPPLDVNFSGAGSSDPDNDPLTYDWNFGDGTAHSTQRDVLHRYGTVGEYDARLTVSDNKGASASATVHVSVGNSPPSATIQSPVDGSDFLIGKKIELRGAASDPEDGPLSGTSLQWQVSLIHNTHTHDLTGLTGTVTSFTAASDHDANSHYRITLVATDSAGRTATKVVNVYPRAVRLTLASSPSGAPLTYAGTTSAAPVTQTSAVDFVSSISAASSFTSGSTTYEFVGWSDGGARAHNITIPSADATLTAQYRPQVWFEGETMSPTPNDGVAIRIIAESGASGGNTLSYRKSPSYATAQYTAGAVDQITLRMRGDQCQGPPTAIVSIDSFPTRSIDVVPTTFTDFTLPLDSGNGGAAGTHTVKVEFDNNLVDSTCDRNIYLDTISLRQVPDAPPTVSRYARPRGATPQTVSLVPASNQCRTSNRTHGSPLSYASCAPPTQASGNLTIGTPDVNGAAANMTGQVSLVVCKSPGCASADVMIRASVADVRCLPGEAACGAANAFPGSDYTGELQASVRLRITDAKNGASLTDPATTVDSPFRVTVPCTATAADTTTGAGCVVNTTANAVIPGAVTGGGRTIWQLGQVEVYDGGTDGDAETDGNTVFLRQGLFVP